jgi:ATP-binding cassette, subfamily A (ABC1), member 3
MVASGILYFVIAMMIDYTQQIRFHSPDGVATSSQQIFTLPPDEDVMKEEADIKAARHNEHIVKVKDLYKQYNVVGALPAVRGNTFGIRKNEVLGLLGPNGAGKSTTFSILTMEHQRTRGDAYVVGQPLDTFDCETHGKGLGLCA